MKKQISIKNFSQAELRLIREGTNLKKYQRSNICVEYSAWALKAAKSLHKKKLACKPEIQSSDWGTKYIRISWISSLVVGAKMKLRRVNEMAFRIQRKQGKVWKAVYYDNTYRYTDTVLNRSKKISNDEYAYLKNVKGC